MGAERWAQYAERKVLDSLKQARTFFHSLFSSAGGGG
jgi:hypothetical protein